MARGRNPDDLKMCNCAACHCDLLGRAEAHWYKSLDESARAGLPRLVAGRISGRPYCAACLPCTLPAIGSTISILEEDGTGALYANALRAMEDRQE